MEKAYSAVSRASVGAGAGCKNTSGMNWEIPESEGIWVGIVGLAGSEPGRPVHSRISSRGATPEDELPRQTGILSARVAVSGADT